MPVRRGQQRSKVRSRSRYLTVFGKRRNQLTEVDMRDRTNTDKSRATMENEVQRAASEYQKKRSRGTLARSKLGETPRENRPKLRGAPAAAAVIEGRG
jgi:hypothetical protein